jgi:hypothetical protein
MVSGVDKGTALRDYHKQSPAEQAPPVNDGIYPEKMVFLF